MLNTNQVQNKQMENERKQLKKIIENINNKENTSDFFIQFLNIAHRRIQTKIFMYLEVSCPQVYEQITDLQK